MKNLELFLGKKSVEFTRQDLLKVIDEFSIKDLSFLYIGLDSKIKELRLPINNLEYAEMILAEGERIDGSSIFKTVIPVESSDLYIVPRYESAFTSPFDDKNLVLLCTFLNGRGAPVDFSPESVLIKAHKKLKEETGMTLKALGELEFYLIYEKEDDLFSGSIQRSYHQSTPFVKTASLVKEMMRIISDLTGAVKYMHSEVGFIPFIESDNPEIAGKSAEQFEIEFLLRPVEEMASILTISKWIIRNVAYRYNMSATFTPKLMEGMAGTGLHFHMALFKDEKNMMVDEKGNLSEMALRMMANMCEHAPSLTAFGNSIASSFMRLVANQEAPINICWSEQNRQALIRVPLGWGQIGDIGRKVNPNDLTSYESRQNSRQTVEYRGADGSADIFLFLAAVTLTTLESLKEERAIQQAERYHVRGDIYKEMKEKDLGRLPKSCFETAQFLEKERDFYQKGGIFPVKLIDYVIRYLKNENDESLIKEIELIDPAARKKFVAHLMHKDLHKN